MQATLTLVMPERVKGHLTKPIPDMECYVMLSFAHKLPAGMHPEGWTMLMEIGRVCINDLLEPI